MRWRKAFAWDVVPDDIALDATNDHTVYRFHVNFDLMTYWLEGHDILSATNPAHLRREGAGLWTIHYQHANMTQPSSGFLVHELGVVMEQAYQKWLGHNDAAAPVQASRQLMAWDVIPDFDPDAIDVGDRVMVKANEDDLAHINMETDVMRETGVVGGFDHYAFDQDDDVGLAGLQVIFDNPTMEPRWFPAEHWQRYLRKVA